MNGTIVYNIYNYSSANENGMHMPDSLVVIRKELTAGQLASKLSLSFAIVGMAILMFSYAPGAFFWAKSLFLAKAANYSLSNKEISNLSQTQPIQRSTFQPAFNPKLPKTNRLVIPAIGVKTDIQEAPSDDYEAALKKGVWRVTDFGSPNNNSMPTILAAHRYGYLAWSNSFRHFNSFYNLPKLKVGDVVEIDYNQRKYMYEIYAADNGSEITDYNADLILYTCVDLNGPERIFRYARLMEI